MRIKMDKKLDITISKKKKSSGFVDSRLGVLSDEKVL